MITSYGFQYMFLNMSETQTMYDGLTLVQRRYRRPDVGQTLVQLILLTGKGIQ